MAKAKQENPPPQDKNNVEVMTHSELRTALKPLKAQGVTQIKLNASKAILEAEYNRLMSLQQPPATSVEMKTVPPTKAEMETAPPSASVEEKLDERTFREQLSEKMRKEQNNPDPTPEEKREFWANIDRACFLRKQHKRATEQKRDEKTRIKAQKEVKQKEEKTVKQEKPSEKKRYKILAGNGCHQAIAEVQGMLIPPAEEDGKFNLILPDGLQIEASFKTSRQHWLACNTDVVTGMHWFRCYPKMSDNKLVCLQIIAWDGEMADNKYEKWEFTGVWTAQRNITVQRTMSDKDIRKIAKETGFIKKFKFTFTNSFQFKRNLWVGYVYKILATRKKDVFEIRKVIPYACPRIKPKPPERKPPAKRK